VLLSIKFVVSQAECIYLYKNLRTKVQKCSTNIYFNCQYLKQGVISKYAHIKAPCTSPVTKVTQKKTQTSRIREEINYLYKNKDRLNESPYKNQLQAAPERGKSNCPA